MKPQVDDYVLTCSVRGGVERQQHHWGRVLPHEHLVHWLCEGQVSNCCQLRYCQPRNKKDVFNKMTELSNIFIITIISHYKSIPGYRPAHPSSRVTALC